MRTSRITTTALAAVTAALALGLSACGNSDGSANASGSTDSVHSQAAADNTGPKTTGQNGGSKSAPATKTPSRGGGAKQQAGGAGTSGTDEVRPCQGAAMMLVSTHKLADQQGDHLLITASNGGDKACWITSHPDVKINGEGDVLPLSKKAEGGTEHITLQPGQKVYSAVNLFAYTSGNRTGNAISLALRGDDGTAGPYYSVAPKGAKQDFTYNEADVLNWNTEKPYNF